MDARYYFVLEIIARIRRLLAWRAAHHHTRAIKGGGNRTGGNCICNREVVSIQRSAGKGIVEQVDWKHMPHAQSMERVIDLLANIRFITVRKLKKRVKKRVERVNCVRLAIEQTVNLHADNHRHSAILDDPAGLLRRIGDPVPTVVVFLTVILAINEFFQRQHLLDLPLHSVHIVASITLTLHGKLA